MSSGLRWVSGDRLLCAGDASDVAKQLVCGWRQIAARLGFPDVTEFLAQRLAVSLVASQQLARARDEQDHFRHEDS